MYCTSLQRHFAMIEVDKPCLGTSQGCPKSRSRLSCRKWWREHLRAELTRAVSSLLAIRTRSQEPVLQTPWHERSWVGNPSIAALGTLWIQERKTFTILSLDCLQAIEDGNWHFICLLWLWSYSSHTSESASLACKWWGRLYALLRWLYYVTGLQDLPFYWLLLILEWRPWHPYIQWRSIERKHF